MAYIVICCNQTTFILLYDKINNSHLPTGNPSAFAHPEITLREWLPLKSKDLFRVTVFQGRVLHFVSTISIFDTCIYYLAVSYTKMNPAALWARPFRWLSKSTLFSLFETIMIFAPSEIFTIKNLQHKNYW